MYNLIRELILDGYKVSFHQEILQFELRISKDGVEEFVHLPISDHLTEAKIIKYAELLKKSVRAQLDEMEEAWKKFRVWLSELKEIAYKFDPKEYNRERDWEAGYFKATYFDKGFTAQDAWTEYLDLNNKLR